MTARGVPMTETLLLAVWIGAALLFALVVAPAAFAVLPSRTLAGALVGRGLPVIFYGGGVLRPLIVVLDLLSVTAGGARATPAAISTIHRRARQSPQSFPCRCSSTGDFADASRSHARRHGRRGSLHAPEGAALRSRLANQRLRILTGLAHRLGKAAGRVDGADRVDGARRPNDLRRVVARSATRRGNHDQQSRTNSD